MNSYEYTMHVAYLERRLARAERERDEARKVMSDHLHTARLAALVEVLQEENRVLRLANRTLAGVRDADAV